MVEVQLPLLLPMGSTTMIMADTSKSDCLVYSDYWCLVCSQQGYDMSYGMYPTQGGMGMGTYHQTPSNYGPSRGGYGGMDKDKERGGASGHGGYHPYRR